MLRQCSLSSDIYNVVRVGCSVTTWSHAGHLPPDPSPPCLLSAARQLPPGWQWLPDPEVALFTATNLPRLDMNFHLAPDATADSGARVACPCVVGCGGWLLAVSGDGRECRIQAAGSRLSN